MLSSALFSPSRPRRPWPLLEALRNFLVEHLKPHALRRSVPGGQRCSNGERRTRRAMSVPPCRPRGNVRHPRWKGTTHALGAAASRHEHRQGRSLRDSRRNFGGGRRPFVRPLPHLTAFWSATGWPSGSQPQCKRCVESVYGGLGLNVQSKNGARGCTPARRRR